MTAPAVYAAISSVMREVAKEGIAKTRDNQQTRSKFRGIDDVYNALCGPLADAGLVIMPTLVEHNQVERESKAGGALYCSTVVVDYVFVAVSDGSMHTARVVGEAMDSSDKSFSKAMSFAFKYVCFQAFCIPTEGDNDADAHRPEAKPRTQQQHAPQQRPAPAGGAGARLHEKYSLVWFLYSNSSVVGKPIKEIPPEKLTGYIGRLEKDLKSKDAEIAETASHYYKAALEEYDRRHLSEHDRQPKSAPGAYAGPGAPPQ